MWKNRFPLSDFRENSFYFPVCVWKNIRTCTTVLLVEETRVSGENHRPVAIH
jgi:hypothetical protein